jgi:hypothetical protein
LAQLVELQAIVDKKTAKAEAAEDLLENTVIATTGADTSELPDEILEVLLPIQEEYLETDVPL